MFGPPEEKPNYAHLLQTNAYFVVEGLWQDVEGTPNERPKYEYFAVNGITFAYLPYADSNGFQNIEAFGEPIQPGTLVRVSYLSDGLTLQSRTILRLEIKR